MKTKVLLYCTMAKPYLWFSNIDEKWHLSTDERGTKIYPLLDKEEIESCSFNGTIVAECEVECEKIYFEGFAGPFTDTLKPNEISKKSCIGFDELWNYCDCVSNKYAYHIHNLKPFDRPLELREVEYAYEEDTFENMRCDSCMNSMNCKECYYHYNMKDLTKAPQDKMWVWYKGERYCLISIRPEWVCKILNGEKTIEVRKKILRGM